MPEDAGLLQKTIPWKIMADNINIHIILIHIHVHMHIHTHMSYIDTVPVHTEVTLDYNT